jgi:hypothetical protein
MKLQRQRLSVGTGNLLIIQTGVDAEQLDMHLPGTVVQFTYQAECESVDGSLQREVSQWRRSSVN